MTGHDNRFNFVMVAFDPPRHLRCKCLNKLIYVKAAQASVSSLLTSDISFGTAHIQLSLDLVTNPWIFGTIHVTNETQLNLQKGFFSALLG